MRCSFIGQKMSPFGQEHWPDSSCGVGGGGCNLAHVCLAYGFMWITQTYLSSPEPDSKLHLYYLFENYKDGHTAATREIEKELERLAESHRDVCILMPQENSADRIEGELRGNQKLWLRFSSDLPGIVISRCPIEKIDSTSDELFFISLNVQGFSEESLRLGTLTTPFAEKIAKLRRLVSDDLEWQHREIRQFEKKPSGMIEGFFEAVELKPGIAGFRVDLKKLFSR
jgi:hypothetical protein